LFLSFFKLSKYEFCLKYFRAVRIVRKSNRIRIFLGIRFGFVSRIHCEQISGFGIDNRTNFEDSTRIRFDILTRIRDSIQNETGDSGLSEYSKNRIESVSWLYVVSWLGWTKWELNGSFESVWPGSSDCSVLITLNSVRHFKLWR